MASHIAVLWMIAGLGIPGVDATHWREARAHSALPGVFSQAGELALTGQDWGAKDASHHGVLGSEAIAQRSASPDMPVARPPVPFLRGPRRGSPSPLQQEIPEAAAEEESQDEFDMEAVKAAVERDGYKRVVVLDKAGNGAWRAKAYRGAAEVILKVDPHGAVSAE